MNRLPELYYLKASSMLLAIMMLAPASANPYAPYPAPDSGYVSDYANLIEAAEEEDLEQRLRIVEDETGVEIIVMTIEALADYPGTKNNSIESFGTALFNTYGIGNMPDNNGVLLLVSLKDRRVRIELGKGYSWSRDADAKAIIDKKILPHFKKNQYQDGVIKGANAIAREFGSIYLLTKVQMGLIAAAGILFLGMVVSLFRHGKRGWGFVLIGFSLLLLSVLYTFFHVTMVTYSDSDSDSWDAGGGGGGFGGGSSGGGGASGGW